MARDEARHAGFLNKSMNDFGLQLDLGFLTANKNYTYFPPRSILRYLFVRKDWLLEI